MRRQEKRGRPGIACVFLLAHLGASGAFVASGSEGETLDVIVAGVDANLSLMHQGTARYRETRYKFLDGIEQGSEDVVVQSMFRDNLLQTKEHRSDNSAEVWHLVDDDKLYWIQPADADDIPYQNNIILYPREVQSDRPWYWDPRRLGHSVGNTDEFLSLADFIRMLRKPGSARKLRVERDANEFKIVAYFPPSDDIPANVRDAKDEIWVAPKQGYSITRQKKWGRPEWPYEETEVVYQKADDDAWVAKRYEKIGRGLKKGRVVSRSHVVVELLEVDFDAPTKPADFTLAGMGLPQGSRIQDRINNREYLLGINAVTEEEVQAEWRRLQREHMDAILAYQRRRQQFITYGIIGALAAIITAVALYRIRWA